MLKKVILDADFCIKVGRFEGLLLLQEVIPVIAQKAYIHRYVYEDEILIPQSAKQQVKRLIDSGQAELIDESRFSPLEKAIFSATRDNLKRAMIGTVERGKNWGEVLSLACAKTLGITIFMSDEGSLQGTINRLLNAGNEYDIHVFRIVDLVEWIKSHPEVGITRKTAKAIWIASGKEKGSFNKVWEPN